MSKAEHADVVLYFADVDGRASLYQIKQWTGPLKRLSEFCKVVVVTASNAATEVAQAAGLRAQQYRNRDDSVKFLKQLRPKVVFYPNKVFETYKVWDYTSAFHVFVSHGESDKSYMSGNSMQYFDFIYAAGEMAIKRLEERVPGFATAARCIQIGRPQLLDELPEPPEDFVADDRKVIMYAPTSDFRSLSDRYGSVASHGLEFVREILSQGDKYQLLYKPHPFTGSVLPDAIEANRQIIELIKEAANGHRYDQSPFGWQVKVADLMIADVSAVTYDWLATGKPVLITKPIEPLAWMSEGGILGATKLLVTEQANRVTERIDEALNDPASKAFFEKWSRKYYAPLFDERSGQERFIARTMELVARAKDLPQLVEDKKSGPQKSQGLKQKLRAKLAGLVSAKLKTDFKKSVALVVNRQVHDVENYAVHLMPAAINMSLVSELCSSGKTLVAVNSVGNYLKLMKLKTSNAKARANLAVAFVPQARDVVRLTKSHKPSKIFYLNHSHNNHFAIRLNGIHHVLFYPERQSGFKVNHSLIAYNEIRTHSEKLGQKIQSQVFRPEGWNFSSGN